VAFGHLVGSGLPITMAIAVIALTLGAAKPSFFCESRLGPDITSPCPGGDNNSMPVSSIN